MTWRKKIGTVAALGGLLASLTACTPADEQYCDRYGVGGTPEFSKCLDYYHAQEAAFHSDRIACDIEADGTYPPTLYDHGHYEEVVGGFGPRGQFYGGQTVLVEPDYLHNAEVDRLRMRIVEPCMQARGWNSGTSWQAGRHAVTVVPKTKPTTPAAPLTPAKANPTLPWLGY